MKEFKEAVGELLNMLDNTGSWYGDTKTTTWELNLKEYQKYEELCEKVKELLEKEN